jgi:hypothetical protein
MTERTLAAFVSVTVKIACLRIHSSVDQQKAEKLPPVAVAGAVKAAQTFEKLDLSIHHFVSVPGVTSYDSLPVVRKEIVQQQFHANGFVRFGAEDSFRLLGDMLNVPGNGTAGLSHAGDKLFVL